jgi:hypothetical protein
MRIAAALFLTTALAGCAESQLVGSAFYLPPYHFEDKTCKELKDGATGAGNRVNEQQRLREKAALSTAGSAIGTVAYSPDYNRAKWEQELYQREYARKNCKDDPPPPPPGATPPPAATPPAGAPPSAPPKAAPPAPAPH